MSKFLSVLVQRLYFRWNLLSMVIRRVLLEPIKSGFMLCRTSMSCDLFWSNSFLLLSAGATSLVICCLFPLLRIIIVSIITIKHICTNQAKDIVKYQESFTNLETFLLKMIKTSDFSFSKFQSPKLLCFRKLFPFEDLLSKYVSRYELPSNCFDEKVFIYGVSLKYNVTTGI